MVSVALLGLLGGCGILWDDDCTCPKPAPQAQSKPATDAGAPPPMSQPAPEAQATRPPPAEPAPLPPAVTTAPAAPAPTAAAPTALAPAPTPVPQQQAAAPAATPPLAPSALPGTAQYGAQLGAFRSRTNAEGAWARFRDLYGDLIAGMPGPVLSNVDLGQKGRFTRVMAGPFNTQNAADSLCLEVLARGGFCHVQRLGR